MFGRTLTLTAAGGGLLFAVPVGAQEPGGQTTPPPAPAPPASAPAPGGPFPTGAEVLSVDGEPLGVLAYVETLDGEAMLHIRKPDGTVAMAPSGLASRGERAVVLDWTRAQFEATRPAEAPTPATPLTPP